MEFDLDNEDTRDLLEGFFAYDSGCVDSGIRDDVSKERLKEYLKALASDGRTEYQLYSKKFNEKLFGFIRDRWSDEMIQNGYGLEDLRSFMNWLEDEMGY